MRKLFLLSGGILFIIMPHFMNAQRATRHTIEWQKPFRKQITEDITVTTLDFKGAALDENFLPVMNLTSPVTGAPSGVRATLSNVVTEPLTDIHLIRQPDKVGKNFEVRANIAYRRKTPMAHVQVSTIRKTESGFERLVSFEVDIQPEYTSANRSAPRQYASASVLSTGTWYKIGVNQNGLHRLDYNFLKNLGIDVDQVNPANIRIYGNGGGMLPFANYKSRYDDLQENAIVVTGSNDGTFDQGDQVIFYGTAQTRWTYDQATGTFNHNINLYADTTFYFLTTDLGPGKRVQTRASLSDTPTDIVTTFDDYAYHEADLVNLLKSGREWYGESLDNLNSSRQFSFNFQNISTVDSVKVRMSFAGRSVTSSANSFGITVNGSSLITQPFGIVGTSPQDNFVQPVFLSRGFIPSTSALNFGISFNSPDPNAQGWVNYISLNARRHLDLAGTPSQFHFRDSRSTGPGKKAEFRLRNANTSHTIWDVTDPLNVIIQTASLVAGELVFTAASDALSEYLVSDGQAYFTAYPKGIVQNQNLHGLQRPSMIIVTHPSFSQQAATLAQFHRDHDNLSVVLATTEEVFNEFSSGAQDISAIRDFIKMFYDRAVSPADMPKYLLLFGDASYDNKNRLSPNTNFVTSYQSPGSINLTQTYISDDYFGLLDDSEGDWNNSEVVDLSIGRIPVKNTTEAEAMVRKIINYASGGAPTMGDWRTVVSFVADDQDSNTHFRQSDTLAARTSRNYPFYNIDKIYIDAFNQETTPGGQRFPDARKAIVDRVQRGALLMTYIGHGGEVGWAHERILEVSDINGWTNFNKLPAFLTATCEFTRVDDPGRTSAGEMVFLNPDGGGICLFTTSRLAFSSSNNQLCINFYTHIFEKIDGRNPTIGEIFEQTKIDVFSDQYVRNFILIGDPAVRLSYPEFGVRTNTINGISITQPTDTVKALSKMTITGEVIDKSGQKMTSFNGIIFPTVYDKWVKYYTLGNDQNIPNDPSTPQPFDLQKNVIFKGKVSVTNGDFSFTFVVPKDIQFHYGFGKLSYYAQNGSIDAGGYYDSVVVGGFDPNGTPDAAGPDIKIYMNDEKFVRGGLTDKNPVLYAVISDSSGVNTVGTGIGHDMTAEMDNNSSKKVVLNDYYENDLNSYQQGRVRYPYSDLEPGPHSITFKVWDVHNNSSIATTDFIVSESAELALEHVLNYPNPFTTNTTFMFEHNRPYIPLDVQVQVFTVSGKLVKTIANKILTTGYRSDELKWDGLDDFGDRIGKGVYVYKLRVRTPDGDYADKFEKLVILR